MQEFNVPRTRVTSEETRAFQAIKNSLKYLDRPLLENRRQIEGIPEGTSAYLLEDDGLYRYTRIRKKLYKEKVAVEEVPETDSETEGEVFYSSRFGETE